MTDQTTPEPLTDDVLDAMRGRSQGIDCAREAYDSAEDVPRLLDEVDRLRTELRNEREQLNRAFAENVRRLGEITGLRTKAKQAWSEGHSAALATGCDSEDQFRANLGALLVAEEQRCQLAINADPTDPHLNGRLAGLQRARDIVTGAAVPAELTEVETDSDPVVLDLRAQLDQARTESLTLGVSLAETIQERQQLRNRLADADRERRAALDVAADLTAERDQARDALSAKLAESVLSAALGAPTGAPLDDRRSSLDRARDILAREAAQEPPTATGGPGPDPSKGTGVPGLEIPAQTIDGRPLGAIEIISRTLVLMCGTSGHDRDEIREIAAALDATLRDVHYRDDAQRLRDTATTRAASAPDAVAYQRAVGIHEAADWLDARSAHEIEAREQTAAAPVGGGWTIYPAFDGGGVMVSHDTDADRPALGALDSIPLASVLAFITDADEPAEDHRSRCCGTCDAIHADRAAREAEPAEPTLRDVMAAAHRAGLGIRRDGDYIARDGNGEAWAYVEWSIVNGHGREVGRIGIEEGGSAYVWLGTRPGKPAQQYLVDPAPADILTAAREAGLIGDTDA